MKELIKEEVNKLCEKYNLELMEFKESKIDNWKNGEILMKQAIINGDFNLKIVEKSEKERQDIYQAKIVVGAGKGIVQSKDMALIKALANRINAAVAVSRPLAEMGYIDKHAQVGYSGHRIKPKIYIACGISGQPQHIAGIKESDTIIAINSDPEAPIFRVADYGLVGDLYQIIPQLMNSI